MNAYKGEDIDETALRQAYADPIRRKFADTFGLDPGSVTVEWPEDSEEVVVSFGDQRYRTEGAGDDDDEFYFHRDGSPAGEEPVFVELTEEERRRVNEILGT